MKILTIHDVRKEYFDLNLQAYQLTFDDGLYSQFYYFPLFQNHPRRLIYFITTSFVRQGAVRPKFDGRFLPPIKSKKYMHRAFSEGRFDHFMNLAEVQEISRQQNVQIGAHSHFHDVILTRTHARKRKPPSAWKIKRVNANRKISFEEFSIRSKLAFKGCRIDCGQLVPRRQEEWEDFIKYDTERCLRWFEQHLKMQPKLYAFPFNEYSGKFIRILKSFGFQQFYGARPRSNAEITGRMDIDALINDGNRA